MLPLCLINPILAIVDKWLDDELKDKLIHIDIQSQIGSITIQINYILFSDRTTFIFEHSHRCSELHYLIQGSEILLVDNRQFPLHEGSIYYIGPDTRHSKIHDLPENTDYLKLLINFELSKVHTPRLKNMPNAEDEMVALESLLGQKRYWMGDDTEGCLKLIHSIFRELSRGRLGYYSVIQNMIANLVVLTIRAMSGRAIADYNVPIKVSPNYALRIVEFIKQHYREDITREDTSEVVFVSTRHINRILREHYGLTFHEMLQHYRLEMTRRLLTESKLSLEQIAEDVGFGSASYLSKLFKDKEGITPSEFRLRPHHDPSG